MEYVAAYKILNTVNKEANIANIKGIFDAIGASFCEKSCNDLLSKVNGKSCSDLVEEGSKKMSSFAVSAAPSKETKAEEKKEEKVEEKKEENTAVDFDLFEGF
ncbi:60S acidic ribosomal protein P2 [Gurleya vavrai]